MEVSIIFAWIIGFIIGYGGMTLILNYFFRKGE